jgi:hypothetical protein
VGNDRTPTMFPRTKALPCNEYCAEESAVEWYDQIPYEAWSIIRGNRNLLFLLRVHTNPYVADS